MPLRRRRRVCSVPFWLALVLVFVVLVYLHGETMTTEDDTILIRAELQKVTPNNSSNRPVNAKKVLGRRGAYPGCGEECTQITDIHRHVDCFNIMEGDRTALESARQYLKYHPRVTVPGRVSGYGGCGQYIDNPYYPNSPNTQLEAGFPIAYSILAHRNPEQLERLIRAIYWPQNLYCIHVDSKSSRHLHSYAKHLSGCFENIFITTSENIVYGGFSRLKADLNCMNDLLQRGKMWKYVINLTGQEYPLKTNLELVNILRIYNGSNDIEGVSKHATAMFRGRFVPKWKEVPKGGMRKLVKEINLPAPGNLTLIKGSAFGVFSYEFVKFVFTDERVAAFLEWLKTVFSPDELLWSTLNFRLYNSKLNTPGGYGGAPERKQWYAKYVSWPPRDKCAGSKVHGICILSTGDLPRLIHRKELFANKFNIERDYLVMHCLEEWLYNKTFRLTPFDYQFYRELPFIPHN